MGTTNDTEFSEGGINEHYQCGPEENKQSAKID